ncbi:MAG: hypothetical protein D6784_03380 [Chloroflexi bacterium]|nr:MAG: hypothetical protein D6784_03380 [Chloroflexota bacterium]
MSASAIQRHLPILLILLLAAYLRLDGLNEPGLWLDEAAYTIAAQKPIIDQIINPIETLRDSIGAADPVLSSIPFALALRLGFSNYTARLPAAMFGILTIATMYQLGRSMFSESVGLASALLLCVSGFHLLYSQEARSYAQLTFFTVASFWFLYRATTRHRLTDWTWYTLVVWAGMSSHYDMAFAVFVQGVFVLFTPVLEHFRTQLPWKNRAIWRNWVYFAAAMVLVFLARLPWLADFLYWSQRTVGGPYPLQLQSNFVRSIQTMLGDQSGILGLYAGLGIIGMAFAFYYRRRAALLLTIWLVLAIPVTIFGLWYVSQFFHQRHVIWSLPAFLLATANGAVAIPQMLFRQRKAPIRTGLTGLVIAPLLVVNLMQAQQIPQIKQHWPLGKLQEATAYIATQARPHEIVIGIPNAQYLKLYIEPVRQDLSYIDTRSTALPAALNGVWYVFFDIQNVPHPGEAGVQYQQFQDLLVVYQPEPCQGAACIGRIERRLQEVIEANPNAAGTPKFKAILSGLARLQESD